MRSPRNVQGLLKPELSAYGDGTTSTQPGGGYGPFAGTSAASAHVAGIVALLLEADPAATPAEIADALYASAQDRGAPGWDPDYGAGIVNARAAVENLTDPCALAGGDGDADTICDDVDNCPGTPNTDQVDTDQDDDESQTERNGRQAPERDSDENQRAQACCADENGQPGRPPFHRLLSGVLPAKGIESERRQHLFLRGKLQRLTNPAGNRGKNGPRIGWTGVSWS